MQTRNNISLFEGVDRVAVALYLLLVLSGLICVASAGYDDMIDGFFNFRQNHIKQALWACAAFVVGLFILLLACWLMAMSLDKKKDEQEGEKPKGRRL